MKRGTPDHPKTLMLADALGIPIYSGVGLLEILWHWTLKYAAAGDIGRWSNAAIARALGWPSDDADRLVDALVSCGWLDADDKVRLVVHDWADHCENSVHVALGRRIKLFADGTRPNLTHLNRAERDRIEAEFEKQAHLVGTQCALDAHQMPAASASALAIANKERAANSGATSPAKPGSLDLFDDDQDKPATGKTGRADAEPESKTPESRTPAADPLEDLRELSDFYDELTGMIQTEHPRASVPAMLTRRWFNWRATLGALHTRDGFDVPEIIAALTWCFCDEEATDRWPGWKSQVQAVPALRKRKSADDLTKFAKIHAAWEKANGAGSSRPYRNANHIQTAEEVAAWDRI